MSGAVGRLADATRAFETYRQVDAIDTRLRAGVADAMAAAKCTTDALVASASDAVATDDAGRSRASDKQRRQTGVEERTGRRSRRDRGAASFRAWSVWYFHMGGEYVDVCADGVERYEVRGTLVKPAGRRAVFLYCDGDQGKNALVASSVLPAGMDAPEPGETMRVGPKAVRVVGEIHDFVVADSTSESDGTLGSEDGMDTSSDLDDADEADERASASASGAATAAATAASWWSWVSSAPAVDPVKPTTPESGVSTVSAAGFVSGWFTGWFSAPEATPAESAPPAADAGVPSPSAPGTPRDAPSGVTSTSSRGDRSVDGPLDDACASGVLLTERRDAPDANRVGPNASDAQVRRSPTEKKRSVVIPAPPPPPSLYAAAASWAPAPIAPEPTDLYHAGEELAAGSMESMESAGAVGFSYAIAAEAAVVAAARGGAEAAAGAGGGEAPSRGVDPEEPKEVSGATPLVSPRGDDFGERAAPEDAAARETTEGGAPPLPEGIAPAPAPLPAQAPGPTEGAAARLTAGELDEMRTIRNRIAELEKFVREAEASVG